MREFVKYGIVIAGALALAGCSGGMGLLDGKANVPVATGVPVGNSLAMPPDLQLATPGQTTDAYQPNGAVAPAAQPVSTKPVKSKLATAAAPGTLYGDQAPAAAPPADIFAQYGISKFNPDGTQKTIPQMNEELRLAILKKKRETNPNYGTIANIGAIFQDQ